MAAVKIRRPIFGTQICVLLWSSKIVTGIRERVRPSIVQVNLRTTTEMLLQTRLQGVVVGTENRRRNIDRPISLERTHQAEHARIGAIDGAGFACGSDHRSIAVRTRQGLVNIHNSNQVFARVAVVSDVENEAHGQLLLHIQTPHLGIRQAPACSHSFYELRVGIHARRAGRGIIKDRVGNVDCPHKRRIDKEIVFQKTDRGSIVEHPEASSNRSLTVPKWVPGKTEARSEVRASLSRYRMTK